MQKAKSPSKGKSEEFGKFERLAKALVSVPKKEVEQAKAKQEKDKPAIPR